VDNVAPNVEDIRALKEAYNVKLCKKL